MLNINDLKINNSQYNKYIDKLAGNENEIIFYFRYKDDMIKVLKRASLTFGIFPYIVFNEDEDETLCFSKHEDVFECDDDEYIEFNGIYNINFKKLSLLNIKLYNNDDNISKNNSALLYSIFDAIKQLLEEESGDTNE